MNCLSRIFSVCTVNCSQFSKFKPSERMTEEQLPIQEKVDSIAQSTLIESNASDVPNVQLSSSTSTSASHDLSKPEAELAIEEKQGIEAELPLQEEEVNQNHSSEPAVVEEHLALNSPEPAIAETTKEIESSSPSGEPINKAEEESVSDNPETSPVNNVLVEESSLSENDQKLLADFLVKQMTMTPSQPNQPNEDAKLKKVVSLMSNPKSLFVIFSSVCGAIAGHALISEYYNY